MGNRGAALVWAVISVVLVSILVAAALTAGNSYASRSIHENQQRQAYLTARSGAEAVVSLLDGYSVRGEAGDPIQYNSPLIPETVGQRVSLTGFTFPAEMGECQGFVERVRVDQLEVLLTAQVGERRETVKALIEREITIVPGTAEGSSVADLFKGLYVNDLTMQSNTSLQTSAGTNLYVSNFDITGAVGSTISIDIGRDFYINKKNKVENLAVNVGGAEKDFVETALPGYLYLEKPLIWLNDNPPLDIDLYSTENMLFPYSFVLCKLGAVEANGNQDENGIISEKVDIMVSNDEHPYAIKVTAGSSLHLNLKNDSISGDVPEVYIFLDENHAGSKARLYIHHVDERIKLFVCGGSKSIVTIAEDVAITGSISVDNLTIEAGKSLTLDYAAPGDFIVYTSDPKVASGGEPAEGGGAPEEGGGEPAEGGGAPEEGGGEPAEGGEEPPVEEIPDIEVHTWSLEKYEEG